MCRHSICVTRGAGDENPIFQAQAISFDCLRLSFGHVFEEGRLRRPS